MPSATSLSTKPRSRNALRSTSWRAEVVVWDGAARTVRGVVVFFRGVPSLILVSPDAHEARRPLERASVLQADPRSSAPACRLDRDVEACPPFRHVMAIFRSAKQCHDASLKSIGFGGSSRVRVRPDRSGDPMVARRLIALLKRSSGLLTDMMIADGSEGTDSSVSTTLRIGFLGGIERDGVPVYLPAMRVHDCLQRLDAGGGAHGNVSDRDFLRRRSDRRRHL